MVAASKPTSSLSMKPHLLSTEHNLGTLAAGLGCFPLDDEAYPPPSHCCALLNGIRSLIGVGRRNFSDKYRGESFAETFPELYVHLEEYFNE